MVDLHPAFVHLLRCLKAFYANGAGRLSNDDLVARAVFLGSNLALNGLVAALEEVEHAARLWHVSINLEWLRLMPPEVPDASSIIHGRGRLRYRLFVLLASFLGRIR